jgi:hypothetical protein
MSRRRSKAGPGAHAASSAAPSAGLELHEAATRVQALLRERGRLLRDVQKKKLQLERVQQQISRDAAASVAVMAPLVRRHDALLAELKALFAELARPGRISARARKQVARLRRLLELQGVLAPSQVDDEVAADDEADDEAWHGAPGSEPRPDPGASASRPGGPAPRVAGAEQVGQQRRSLRELFRSLAKAVHPDQARHDSERERRTEVMKEVTRAYEDGDLARLLELESSWQSEQAVSENGDSLARCRELERVNRELLDQVRRLTRQIRDLKREALDASMGLAPDELAEQASRELDELEEICRFVEKLRDGKLSAAELERGPRSLEVDDELELLEQLFSAYVSDSEPSQQRSRRRRA